MKNIDIVMEMIEKAEKEKMEKKESLEIYAVVDFLDLDEDDQKKFGKDPVIHEVYFTCDRNMVSLKLKKEGTRAFRLSALPEVQAEVNLSEKVKNV